MYTSMTQVRQGFLPAHGQKGACESLYEALFPDYRNTEVDRNGSLTLTTLKGHEWPAKVKHPNPPLI